MSSGKGDSTSASELWLVLDRTECGEAELAMGERLGSADFAA
jgi:hypothetical protein